jgi:chemotaxis protein MotB
MSGGSPGTKREASEARRRRRDRLPWLLLVGAVGLLGVGGWLGWGSLSAQLRRVEQLEREAAESEARVAELQVLRDGMSRRLRLLEQEQEQRNGARPVRVEKGSQRARREAARAELLKQLQEETRREEAFVEEAEGRLRVELADRLLFEGRKAALSPGGAELLARVGARLGAVEGHLVQVSVHTDAAPEGTEGAPTSWELSAARAVAVVRFLEEKLKVPPERLMATGHGSSHPVVSDNGPQARARNRRVELLLTPAPR